MAQPAYLVYRAESYSDPSIAGHIEGHTRNAITDAAPKVLDEDGRPLGVELLCEPMPTRERQRLRRQFDRDTKGRNGRPPGAYAEHLFIAERRIGGRWTPNDAREWAKRCLDAIREIYPESLIVTAALHLDETEYHCHILTVPRATNCHGEIKHGISAARVKADLTLSGRQVGDLARPGSRKVSAAAASRLQDAMWERVGEPWGLRRGEKGSKRRHRKVRDAERVRAHGEEVERREAEVKRMAGRFDFKARAALADRRDRKLAEREAAANARSGELDAREAKLADGEAELDEAKQRAEEREAEFQERCAAELQHIALGKIALERLMQRWFASLQRLLKKHGVRAKNLIKDDELADAIDRGSPHRPLQERGKELERLLEEPPKNRQHGTRDKGDRGNTTPRGGWER